MKWVQLTFNFVYETSKQAVKKSNEIIKNAIELVEPYDYKQTKAYKEYQATLNKADNLLNAFKKMKLVLSKI